MPCAGAPADNLQVGDRVFDPETQLSGKIVKFDLGLALVEFDGIPQRVWCVAKKLQPTPGDGLGPM